MNQSRHFKVLDGLRGVAALAVLLYHVSVHYRLPWRPEHATLAVDFFFGLSGFVIAHAYDTPFAQGRMGLRAFARKRIVRLYPMILLGVVLGGICAYLSATHGAPKPLSEIAFLTATAALLLPVGVFLGKQAFFVNAPLWSLFFEAIANVIYGVMGVRLRLAAPGAPALIASAVLLVAVAGCYGTVQGLGFERSYWFIGGIARLAFPFLVGVLISRSKVYLGVPALPGWLIAFILTAIMFGPSGRFDVAYDLAAILLVFPVIISAGANATSSARSDRVWSGLGELSYPLYAIHSPVIDVVSKLHNHLPGFPAGAAAAASAALAIAAAWAALVLYDRPVRAWLSRPRTDSRGGPIETAPA